MIARRIKALRNELKMSQKDFADAIHISRGYMPTIEKEGFTPSDRVLRLISYTFGVRVEWLKTGEGDKFIKDVGTTEDKLARLAEIEAAFDDEYLFGAKYMILFRSDEAKSMLNYMMSRLSSPLADDKEIERIAALFGVGFPDFREVR